MDIVKFESDKGFTLPFPDASIWNVNQRRTGSKTMLEGM